jgi:hypothetical protein
MHHDGMHFFPLGADGRRALLVMNHEYTDEHLLHGGGDRPGSPEKTRKSQHAMGVSVIELALGPQGWRQVLPSPYARRIHGNTPMRLAGPAAGAPALRTAADPQGTRVLGTFANCAMGVTPWGTYLTCEENFNGYFGGPAGGAAPDAVQKRYGIAAGGEWVDWWRHDPRFDVSRHPNEANRFGWVVEIDPMDPTSTPVKRTALGRKKQESATCALTADGCVAVYMGDDQRNEYIYKFVSRDKVRPGGYAANKDVLDHGRLYVGRFDAGGQGQWIELAQQPDVLINARGAADTVRATPLGRPEWIAVHPATGEVFASLTGSSQILQWTEAGGDAAATAFTWKQAVFTGDAFGAPDGLHFDAGGLLWIQTDMSGQSIGKGPPYAGLGNNAMLCADPGTGAVKRFLSGPRGCEITGCVVTPDRRALFVNIQHPGENSDDGGSTGSWPAASGRPRSATVLVRRSDGGAVGT